MDVLDVLEPGHPTVVDVMCLVVKDCQLRHIANDLAEVSLAVGRLADRFRSERIEEVVSKVVVLEGWVLGVSQRNSMDVREEDVPGVAKDAYVVLDVKG